MREQDPELALRQQEELRRRARVLADQVFSRTAGAQLVGGNAVRLHRDAAETYPAWLEAIDGANRYIHFENYILHDDKIGNTFADAMILAARRGVRVRLIYDWMGCLGIASSRFWNRLRSGGVEVRTYNPPKVTAPLGWLSRDHRKMLAVDGTVAFVTGLCVGDMWVGDPARKLEPWRDTGLELRGPAVADVEEAFAQQWVSLGPPIPAEDRVRIEELPVMGTVAVRVIDSLPSSARLLRLDQLFASLARKRIWLTDAYYTGTASHVQALKAAAREGVDVRLLLPNTSDIPILKPVSQAGYVPLLEAGVRIFEWNGTMLHAKTAVVDGRWARVGSSNLNLASWLNNCELDVAIEDEGIAGELEAHFLEDLANSTEIVLEPKPAKAAGAKAKPRPFDHRENAPALGSRGGRSGPAAAGALRVGHALGAAISSHRVLEDAETRLMVGAGGILLALALLFWWVPWLLAYPLIVGFGWVALSLLYGGWKLRQRDRGEQKKVLASDGKRPPARETP